MDRGGPQGGSCGASGAVYWWWRRAARTAATTSSACSRVEHGADRDGEVGARGLLRAGQLDARCPTPPSRAGGARARGSTARLATPESFSAAASASGRVVAHDVQVPRGPRALGGARERGRARRGRPPRSARRRRGGRRTRRRGAGAARAGSRPAARRGGSCGRPARTCSCRASRGSAASAGARRARRRRVVTAPPSPKQGRFFEGKNENVASVPSEPGRPASVSEPADCAASSITGTPSASISATGATLPNRCTASTARVRGRERGAHGVGGHAGRLGVDVAEHGPRARVDDRLRGGVEGERGDDDVVARADAERAQRERDRVRPVGDADGVAGAEVGGELLLEGGHLGAEDERAAIDDLGDLRVDLARAAARAASWCRTGGSARVQRRSRKFPRASDVGASMRKPQLILAAAITAALIAASPAAAAPHVGAGRHRSRPPRRADRTPRAASARPTSSTSIPATPSTSARPRTASGTDGEAPTTNGCDSGSLPLGTPVEVDGASRPARSPTTRG